MLGSISALREKDGESRHLGWDASAIVEQAVGRSQRGRAQCAGARATYSQENQSQINYINVHRHHHHHENHLTGQRRSQCRSMAYQAG